jgi:hypothetical protein
MKRASAQGGGGSGGRAGSGNRLASDLPNRNRMGTRGLRRGCPWWVAIGRPRGGPGDAGKSAGYYWQQAFSQHDGAGEQTVTGTRRQTCTGTCLHTVLGTHRVTVTGTCLVMQTGTFLVTV